LLLRRLCNPCPPRSSRLVPAAPVSASRSPPGSPWPACVSSRQGNSPNRRWEAPLPILDRRGDPLDPSPRKPFQCLAIKSAPPLSSTEPSENHIKSWHPSRKVRHECHGITEKLVSLT